MLKIIKKKSAHAGFTIGDSIAGKFLASGLDPAWFSGAHNFLEFMAHNVRAKYPKEPPERQRDIFISAVSWDNLREAYPAWKQNQEAAERERASAHARDHPPEVCPGCGGAMSMLKCPACGGFVKFREEGLTWDFSPPDDFNLARDFQKIRRKEVPKALPADADF